MLIHELKPAYYLALTIIILIKIMSAKFVNIIIFTKIYFKFEM
jgi:hypothetical protein